MIATNAAKEPVVAVLPIEAITAIATKEQVATIAAIQTVIAIPTKEPIIAVVAIDAVIAAVTEDVSLPSRLLILSPLKEPWMVSL